MYAIPLASNLFAFPSSLRELLVLDAADNSQDALPAAARVRAKFYFDLIETYHYPPSRIEFDVLVPNAAPGRVADVVVYCDAAHTKPFMVAECREAWMQEDLYMDSVGRVLENAQALKAKFGVFIAGSRVQVMTADGSLVTGMPDWEGWA